MQWDYTLNLIGESLLSVGVFTKQDLAIEVSILNQPKTWHKAGYLHPLISIDGIDIPAKPIAISLTAQIIHIPYLAYKLRFVPVPYLGLYTLKLLTINMSISPGVYTPPVTGGDVVTSPIASLTAATLLPANPLRMQGFLINKSNRALWLNLSGGVATTASPNTLIPAGANFDIPEGYTGAINGIWSGPTPTAGAEIHEFSQA